MTAIPDLRTMPVSDLCKWVAVKIPGLVIPAPFKKFAEWYAAHPMEAVAAAEAKARKGRLKEWDFRTSLRRKSNDWSRDPHYAQWWKDGKEGAARAPTEPEARLRALALACQSAGKEGR